MLGPYSVEVLAISGGLISGYTSLESALLSHLKYTGIRTKSLLQWAEKQIQNVEQCDVSNQRHAHNLFLFIGSPPNQGVENIL